jgi:pyruvate/2-oxoglutarate dehydrogenase complex dihydrolipoamide acyltransferase (E2) component
LVSYDGGVSMTRSKVDTSWRRVAAAVFEPPRDGKVMGSVDLDMRAVLAAMEEWKEQGHHVTANHVFMSTIGHILTHYAPELNAYSSWGRVHHRGEVTVASAVLIDGKDLTTVKIRDADKKSVTALADEMNEKVRQRREGRDERGMSNRNGLAKVPWPLRKWTFKSLRWLVYEAGFSIKGAGLSRDLFGSVLISNIGALGLEYGFPALMPASNLSFVMCIGRVQEKAKVIDGKIVACPVLPVAGTFDHRIADGAHIGKLAQGMHHYFENPYDLIH